MYPLKNDYKNIGLFAGSMSSNYHEGIAIGAHAAAQNLPVNLIILAGGPIHAVNPLVQSRDQLFKIIDPSQLDALIIPLSSLTRYMTQEEIDDFLDRYSGIPIINIGTFYEGLVNIMPDYQSGLEQLMKHYIVDHGYKRIVLQRGPKNHASSNVRTEIYKSILENYHIPYDEELVIYGDLERNSTNDFVRELISRDIDYDAIIAINSNSTLTLIGILKKAGISVPEDVAFAGMTGLSDEFYSTPELTLIDEDFHALGLNALNHAYASIQNDIDDKNVWIPMKLSIGESCGCVSKRDFTPTSIDVPNNPVIQAYYDHASSSKDLKSYQANLYDLLVKHQTSNDFIPMLESACHYYMKYLKESGLSREACLKATDYFSHLTNAIQRNAIRFRRHETMYYINFLRDIGNMLNTAYDLSIIEKHVTSSLGINDCFINIFLDSNKTQERMRNIISIKDSVRLSMPNDYLDFDSASVLHPLTPHYSKPYSLLFLPLIFRSQYYGNLIVNYEGAIRGSAIEALETLISTTVMNEIQIQDLLEAKSRFNDMVYNTNDWLIELNEDNEIIFSSNSVKNIIGYDTTNVRFMLLDDLLIPGSKSCLDYIAKQKGFDKVDCSFYHKNKSIVFCLITAIPTYKEGKFSGYRGVIEDVTKQRLQDEKIRTLASYDPLTGLPNRSMIMGRIERMTANAYASNAQGAILFINIDHFKKVNDTLGHSMGDQLLQMYSDTLKSIVAHQDNIARISGDEFMIIVERMGSIKDVQSIISKLNTASSKPYILAKQPIYLTSCIGVSIYPSDGHTAEELINSSTNAMRRAKAAGRNKHMFYDKNMDYKNSLRLQTETLLHRAIKEHLLYVEYQPKVNVKTGLINGLEALVRIRDDNGETVSPVAFIGLAEELDLIGQIDFKVLTLVCQECAELLRRDGDFRISVNMSAKQLKKENLSKQYMDIIEAYGVSPSSLCIELTESALIENESIAKSNLYDLAGLGFAIDLDDFGTGYASLSYFANYPFDAIKIDRSFITSSVGNRKRYAILETITTMARNLDLNVVAEGVESKEQLEMIKSLDISQVQGYYFEKPRPMRELIERITNRSPYPID